VGERLSARFRLVGRPLGRCVSGPSPSCAIVAFIQVPSLAIPAIRVVRKEEDRRSYSLSSASGDHASAHRSPTPFQRRGCGLPLDLLGPRGAFTEPCPPSDALVVTRRHARPASVPTDALSVIRSLRMVMTEIDLRAEGPCFALPVKARRAKAREHLPSCREPASRNPQAELARTFNGERSSAHRFAFSRLVLRVRRCFELPSG
jgi:hypothetical protein